MRGHTIRKVWRHDPTLYAPPRYRRACAYETFIPDPLHHEHFTLPSEVAATLSEVERKVLDLDRMPSTTMASLSRLLLRTESIASSKVEGMQADVRALALAEAQRRAGRSVGRQVSEIIANIDAMEEAVQRTADAPKLSPAGICEIHAVLMERDVTRRSAGKLREGQNWIGGNDYNPCGADYVPPPPEAVGDLLENLCEFSESEEVPPLLQAAVAHAQFETIHPFDDGNGRTGRALVQALLRRRGLSPRFVPPISVALSSLRDAYIQGLVGFREGQVDEWVTFFGSATGRATDLASHYHGLVVDLQEFWRRRLRETESPRSHATAWAIIDTLPEYPALTVADAVEATGRSQPAVNKAFSQLESAGVLAPLGRSRRYRVWEPTGLLDLIGNLEAGQTS